MVRSLLFLPVVLLAFVSLAPQASLAHTNKDRVRHDLETQKDVKYVIYGKEIDEFEYTKLLAAIAASVASDNPGPLAAYLESALDEMVKEVGVKALLKLADSRGDILKINHRSYQFKILTYNNWTEETVPDGIRWRGPKSSIITKTVKVSHPNHHQPCLVIYEN